MENHTARRRFIETTGTTGAAAFAGCTGDEDGGDRRDNVWTGDNNADTSVGDASGEELSFRIPPRGEIQQGETVSLSYNTKWIHLFDPETGDAVYQSEADGFDPIVTTTGGIARRSEE